MANRGLVGTTLRLYFPAIPPAAWDDAFQAGLLGLLRAAELYDPEKGFAFGTYAVRWIRQSISRSSGERELIRIPQHYRGAEREQLRERLLTVRLKGDHAGNVAERPRQNDHAENLRLAVAVLRKLPRREARVLRARFLWGWSQERVGRLLGVGKAPRAADPEIRPGPRPASERSGRAGLKSAPRPGRGDPLQQLGQLGALAAQHAHRVGRQHRGKMVEAREQRRQVLDLVVVLAGAKREGPAFGTSRPLPPRTAPSRHGHSTRQAEQEPALECC